MSLGFINNKDGRIVNKIKPYVQENDLNHIKVETKTKRHHEHCCNTKLTPCKIIFLITCIEVVCVSIPLIISVFKLT